MDSKEDNINKQLAISDSKSDSYSHRIYDDLCEDILIWLPFEDKIKLIFVSKQFQRCLQSLWMKQKVLNVDSEDQNDRNNCLKFVTDLIPGSINSYSRVEKLIKIFENFQNIRSIRFTNCLKYVNTSQIFDLIIENTNRLDSFSSDSYDFDFEQVLNFAKKFGPTIRSLSLTVDRKSCFQIILKYCTSLSSLKLIGNSDIMFEFEENSYYIIVNNLIQLRVDIKCLPDLDRIVENNPQLTHLDIGIKLNKSLEVCAVFEKISHLKQLIDVRIRLEDNNSYNPQMAKSFEAIGENCKNLKSVNFEVCNRQSFPTKEFLNGMKSYSNLKRFCLYSINLYDYLPKKYNLDINFIKNNKYLTHLELTSDNIPKEFFSKIDSIFPHLKRLFIDIEDGLSDQVLKSMAKLNCLERLTIFRSNYESTDSITDWGMLSLIDGCNHLNDLRIHTSIAITERTIDQMIQKAIEYPKVYFKYNLEVINEDLDIDSIESKCLKLNNIEILCQIF